MQKISVLIAFFTCSLFINAQTVGFQWAKSIGGASRKYSNAIITDASGNVYTTGTFSNTMDFDPSASAYPLTSKGDYDIFISKLDASGNFLWAKQIGGIDGDYVNNIITDATGNIYTVGSHFGVTDFDPGTGLYNLGATGAQGMYISKLNSAGDFIWAKNFVVPFTSFSDISDIITDASNNVYVTGGFAMNVDLDPGPGTYTLGSGTSLASNQIFVLKLDPIGNFIWAKDIEGLNYSGSANSIGLDQSNNIYAVGNFFGTADFDTGTGILNFTANNENVFILKLNNNGNFIWAKPLGDTTTLSSSAKVDALGNIYTTGRFVATVDFDPGPFVYQLTSPNFSNTFISKLDSLGIFRWAKSFSGYTSYGVDLALDQYNGVYTTGNFYGVADFDPGFGTFTLTSGNNNYSDVYISKLDNYGNFVWAKNIGCNVEDDARAITIDGINNIYTTGGYQFTADFDPDAGISNLTATTINEGDIFIQKMGQIGVGIKENQQVTIVNAYPNPTKGIINIESAVSINNNVKVQILNLLGQILLEENIDTSQHTFNIQNFTNGLYFLKIFIEGKLISTQKIIKE